MPVKTQIKTIHPLFTFSSTEVFTYNNKSIIELDEQVNYLLSQNNIEYMDLKVIPGNAETEFHDTYILIYKGVIETEVPEGRVKKEGEPSIF